MSLPAIAVRFVGMLSSQRAEAAVRAGIGALQARAPQVQRWDVCMRPPLVAGPLGSYAVRAQAHLADGSVVSNRAQAGELLDAVRDAFEGVEALLRQEYAGGASATCATC